MDAYDTPNVYVLILTSSRVQFTGKPQQMFILTNIGDAISENTKSLLVFRHNLAFIQAATKYQIKLFYGEMSIANESVDE